MNTRFSKMRVAYIAVLVIVCLVFVVSGCGPTIPTEEYDNALKADLKKTKAELATVKTDLARAEAELASARAELEKPEVELATARSDLEKTEAELATARAELEKTKAELATARVNLEKTKEQIAEASSAWSSLKPKVELLLILMENIEANSDIALYTFGFGSVTVLEAMTQVEDQWERLAVALEAIGSAELTESLEYGWTSGLHGSWNAETRNIKHHTEWNRATRLLIDLAKPDMESLSEQVSQ